MFFTRRGRKALRKRWERLLPEERIEYDAIAVGAAGPPAILDGAAPPAILDDVAVPPAIFGVAGPPAILDVAGPPAVLDVARLADGQATPGGMIPFAAATPGGMIPFHGAMRLLVS